ncbi:MAG: YjbQ family protein [Opitutales bacterium]|nr:YjbQ family protein [Opitutales bacterium]
MVFGEEVRLPVKGFSGMVDITGEVTGVARRSKIRRGLVNVFPIGSTSSITTIEYEPALVEDFQQKLEEFVSRDWPSRHSETWGDDNGFSHVRASFMGPGMTLPLHEGDLVLGTWQQIVLINHDNRDRERRVFVQVMGEG